MTKDFWDERYKQDTFAYGEKPNHFLKEELEKLEKGKMLFAAEGEGRNAVFAATKGWDVYAFDISEEGKKKAQLLAKNNQVSIHYEVGILENLSFTENKFDAIALIYAHFPAELKSKMHHSLNKLLKINGTIIFEAFSKNNLELVHENPKIGGPKDIDMLFSIEELKADFPNYEIIELEEKLIDLNEGIFHNGTGAVIRFVGKKIA